MTHSYLSRHPVHSKDAGDGLSLPQVTRALVIHRLPRMHHAFLQNRYVVHNARQRTAWRFRPLLFFSREERAFAVLVCSSGARMRLFRPACLAKQSLRRRHVNQGTRRRRPLRQAARETGRNDEGRGSTGRYIYVSCSEVVTEVYVTFSHRAADRLLFLFFWRHTAARTPPAVRGKRRRCAMKVHTSMLCRDSLREERLNGRRHFCLEIEDSDAASYRY